MKSKNQRMTEWLFSIYIVALVWIIVFKMANPFAEMDVMRSVNFVPYAAPTRIGGEIVYEEIYFNILAFVPFGLYAEILFKKWHVVQKVFLFLLVSTGFEVIQYALAIGVSDITDIVNNVLGGILGLILYKMINQWVKNKHQTHKLVNLFAAIATLLVLVLLLIIKIT